MQYYAVSSSSSLQILGLRGLLRSKQSYTLLHSIQVVCSLFNDISSLTILHSLDMLMMMNWEGFGRKRLWPNFKELSWNSSGGTEKNHKNLNQDNQDSRSPGPRLEPETS
jgi:hypothetical protein